MCEHVDSNLNLMKLSVGTESVEHLAAWQSSGRAQSEDGLPRHVTRMWPKRADELLAGGSIFWVIKGLMLCRQRIVRLEEVRRADGILRCGIVLDKELYRTRPAPRRAFQGWRYLPASDAPPDLPQERMDEEALPAELSAALAEIGVV